MRTIGVRADRAVARAMVVGTMTALVSASTEVEPADLAERLWSAPRV